MGSQPSIIEVPAGHKVQVTRGPDGTLQARATAPPRRNRGFQEVEIKDPDGMRQKGSAGASGTQKSKGTQRVQEKVSLLVDGEDGETDFHTVVGQVQRQKSTVSEFDQPQYSKDDDLALESFYHQNGTVISCLFQSGQRFYLDSWQTQDWQPFPASWYKQGILVTDRIMTSDEVNQASQYNSPTAGDDREGFLEHPTAGRLATYMYEERRNINYYYDEKYGNWVKVPLAWELRHELIKRLITIIQEAVPDWKDKQDIVAALRASNYDPHDTIATYLCVKEKGNLKTARGDQEENIVEEMEAKIKSLEEYIKKLTKKYKRTEKYLAEEREENRAANSTIQELRDRLSTLEVEASTAQKTVQAIQRERPKTARPASRVSLAKMAEPENQVDPQSVIQLNEVCNMLHKEYAKMKMEAQQKFEELTALFKQTAVVVMRLQLCDSDQSKELEEVKELYRKEALQRKLLYNKLQELRGNIRVFCRCRYDDRVDCCLDFPSDREVFPPNSKKMKFDKVFTPNSTQEEVFEDTRPIITSCVDGYNVCILAYGQTGSGKTHTMMGPVSDPGVNIRSIQELLQICEERENIEFTMKGSMVEIYNETIQDLLNTQPVVLDIRTQGSKIHLPGLTEMFVENLDDIQHIMDLGSKNRSVASTKMNSSSSRSHLIFMITVEGLNRASGAISTGSLTLCDLAGSERVGKTEATGQRLVEAAAINKSLTALGQVFTALRTGQLHVPYRNSKLTHILQPSLGGDAKACLFVNVSPDESNVSETISTLQFGSNARQVQLGQAKRNVAKPPAPSKGAWGTEEF